MHETRLGNLFGLTLTAVPSAFVGSLGLWAISSGIAAGWLKLSLGEAIVGGWIALLIHWACEIIHQLGHARAARRAGYPMRGIRMWGVLSASIYPEDEGELPARVHVRRALGGPFISLLVSLATGIIAVLLFPFNGLARNLSLFAFADNFLVFTLGAFAPLGFTDGSTLLRWWGKT